MKFKKNTLVKLIESYIMFEADEEEDRVATFKRLEDTWEDIRELL